ncbi:MAG TPA: hypothetical protein VLM11_14860 [Streptosporangiaceae bacterium]|nr:hypothetical protein [Streptosporangiaceae bacterium]
MTKYMILYRAPVSAREQMAAGTPEQAQAGMAAWMQWAERAGPAIVDMGAPLAEVAEAGTPVPAAGHIIGGYSVLAAASPAALSDLLAGHPHLESGGTIEVHEVLPTPGM